MLIVGAVVVVSTVAYLKLVSDTQSIAAIREALPPIVRPSIGSGPRPTSGLSVAPIGTPIGVDQVGYRTGDLKVAKLAGQADSFTVVDVATGRIAFQGTGTLRSSHDAATGERVVDLDFSALVTPGRYYVEVPSIGRSFEFQIGDAVYNKPLDTVLRGFYLQRCGTAVQDDRFGHSACHLEDGYLWDQPSRKIDVSGGWHDAGDYGKYVPSGAKAVADLTAAYDLYPDRFAGAGGMPAILNEAQWELLWLLKMQRADGGVYHKVTNKGWTANLLPDQDHDPRYVFGVSSAATADFAAVMASAARVYRPFDLFFTDRAMAAALRAWSFLEQHSNIVPQGGFHNPAGIATGEYTDGDDSDERLWAAAELYRATGDSRFNRYVLARLNPLETFFTELPSTTQRQGAAEFAYLFSNGDAKLRESLKQDLIHAAEVLVNGIHTDGYQVVLHPDEFVWGSNGLALNRAVLLLHAERLTDRSDFAQAALDQIHYVFGRNVLAKSFATGIGGNPVLRPHHEQALANPLGDPVPGLLSGGANAADAQLAAAFPARAYADNSEDFTVNETALDMNSALAFVLARFSAPGGRASDSPVGAHNG